MRDKTLRKIEARYGDSITGLQDLTAREDFSFWFRILEGIIILIVLTAIDSLSCREGKEKTIIL